MVAAQRSISPDVFSVDADGGTVTLRGGYSPSSDRYHFPRGEVCPYTGAADIEPVELSHAATLWGWTAVTAAPPGYEGVVPYGFGVVELVHEQLRLITRITEPDPAHLEFGQAMQLVGDRVATDDDGTEVLVWAFAPAVGAAR
ncbi:MAG TPA: OB-fold domain-containing protein [Acidimicrobiia bacterium]|jgi:uncharacterized OB-fold protein